MKIKKRELTGTTNNEIREYEIKNRKLAREIAAEGMILLKNENQVLPIHTGKKIALYGAGAVKTIKGGMGSGDVNSRETVSIYQGLKNAGYTITTEKWIADYEKLYTEKRISWREEIWRKQDAIPESVRLRMFYAYSSTPFLIPAGEMPEKTDTEYAIYVLSRNAGEGKDRLNDEGDYILTSDEKERIESLCKLYSHVILVLNIGGIIDLQFIDEYPEIEAILYVQQPGMEGGNAVADVISGAVTPSGKLTDTWAYEYNDYPSSDTFSHNDNDVDHEEYKEGIYVGYRYFDTFNIPVRYGFGYGLSYTTFSKKMIGVASNYFGTEYASVKVTVLVENTGNKYSGKEVIQLYSCAPQKEAEKEYRKLVAFAKTGLLAPGEKEELTLEFDAADLAYYNEEMGQWRVEAGTYGLFMGSSLSDSEVSGYLKVTDSITVMETEHVCLLESKFEELKANTELSDEKRAKWLEKVDNLPGLNINFIDIPKKMVVYSPAFSDMSEKVNEFTDTLSTDQLIKLSTGNIGKGQGAVIGSAGITVPGSAAETSDCAEENGLAPIVLADGPAGLRLNQYYMTKDGEITPPKSGMALENGFLCRDFSKEEGIKHYQYCTAFPVGTLLAQSWDVELLQKFGRAVAEELKEFDVTLWLAPGMNIHRNPLCGRNFEYYSEDPVVSGQIAAAVTRGVQSLPGYGTTIKHYACNSQEDNRMHSDSVIGERTLREIYLKGFEIAVQKSAPMAIMTSYNLINGVHAANSYDLCTKLLRNEWNYKGVVMTDWTTTMQGDDCTAAGCMRAGNDLIMPGCQADHDNIRAELDKGTLDIRELKRSISRLVNTVWKSDAYEE